MLLQRHAQQLRPSCHILSLHRPRECLILHLLQHSFNLHIANRLGRLHQRTSRKKPRQLIARKQRPLQMRLRLHSGIVRMRQNRTQNLLRPPLLPQVLHSDKRMLRRARMLLIVEVMQQPGARIRVDQLIRRLTLKPQPIGLSPPISLAADRNAQPMLPQALARRPLLHQPQRLSSSSHRTSLSYLILPKTTVYQRGSTSGFSGFLRLASAIAS